MQTEVTLEELLEFSSSMAEKYPTELVDLDSEDM